MPSMNTIALTATLMAIAAPCAGQSRDETPLFVEAGAQAGIERRAHLEYNGAPLVNDSLDATVAVGTASIGAFLGPRVSVRVEAAIPGDLSTRFSPPTTTVSSVPVLIPPTERVELRDRSRTVSVLAGYHPGRWHAVRLGYVAGAAFVYQRERIVTEVTFPGIPPLIPTRVDRRDVTSVTYRAALETGLDLDIVLASRVSVVPQVRVIAFAGALSVRPGIAVRWSR